MPQSPDSLKVSWHRIYYALGAFDVLSVLLSVGLSYKIVQLYSDSVDVNQAWAERSGAFAVLGQIATRADGPGNDVFLDKDVPKQTERFEVEVKAFRTHLVKVQADLEHNVTAEQRARLSPLVAEVGREYELMFDESRNIFAFFNKDREVAGNHMAAMDQHLAAGGDSLAQLSNEVQAIQRATFDEQLSAAHRIRHLEYLLVALVALMVGAVVAYGNKLRRVFQKAQDEIDQRTADMRRVLNNVSQGLLTLNSNAEIASEYSAPIGRWFAEPKAGEKFSDVLRKISPPTAAMFDLGWEDVIADVLPLELTLEQMPRKLTLGDVVLRLDYQAIQTGDKLDAVLVVVTDVSEELRRQRVEAEQRELLALLDVLARDKAGLLEFFEEGERLIEQVVSETLPSLGELRRTVHTLKGNAGLFGLQTVSELCHAMESFIDEENALPSLAQRKALSDRWLRLSNDLSQLLGNGGVRKLEVDHDQYRGLIAAMKACEPHAVLLKAMKDWLLEPTAPRLHRVAEQTKRLAQRLDKGDLQIEIIDNGTRLDPQRFAPIWSSFVHAIRNAVDHGIEGGDERVAAGKTSNGTIRITTRLEGFDAVIEVSDDGRGIDWTRVAACAAELNLPATTPEELEAALFFDGLSTASEVAEISGRGVGMGALRAACAELGGSLHVSSERGKGTTIQARIPVAIQGQSIAPMAAE